MSLQYIKDVIVSFASCSCSADRDVACKKIFDVATPVFYRDVVHLMQTRDCDIELRRAAFKVVAFMTERDDVCTIFMSHNIIPILLKVLQWGRSNPTLIKLVLVITGNLAKNNEDVKFTIADDGGVSSVVELMNASRHDADLIYRGVNWIGYLFNNSEKMCTRYGAMVLDTITHVLLHQDTPKYNYIIPNALMVVEILVRMKNSLAVDYAPTLIIMARKNDARAAKTLATICKGNSHVQRTVMHAGGIAPISELKIGGDWIGPADAAIDNLLHMLTFYVESKVTTTSSDDVSRGLAKIKGCATDMRMAMFDLFLNIMGDDAP